MDEGDSKFNNVTARRSGCIYIRGWSRIRRVQVCYIVEKKQSQTQGVIIVEKRAAVIGTENKENKKIGKNDHPHRGTHRATRCRSGPEKAPGRGEW